MLHSFISLPDDQIDTVINAVTEWCRLRNITVESEEGRRAIASAVDILSNRNVADIDTELRILMDGITRCGDPAPLSDV